MINPTAPANPPLHHTLRRAVRALAWVLAVFAIVALTPRVAAQTPATQPMVSSGLVGGQVHLTTGKSSIIAANRPCKRLSIADPDIATARPVGINTVLLTPKKAGITQLILWDESERSQMIDVLVKPDLHVLQEQLKTLFPEAQIETISANGTILLRGRVPSTQVADQAEQVAAPYANKVLNLLEVSGGQQVMLQVRFAEVSRSATSALGVNLFAADGSFIGGSTVGQINPFAKLPAGQVGDTPAFDGIKTPGHAISPAVTVFGAGQIGSFYLEAFVQALRQNNLLRILAEPNLLAMSGQEASFLAGGSFPIPVAGGGLTAGVSSVTIEMREFGVRLLFTPVVLGQGRIRLKVAPEVSDLDFSTATRVSGFVVPGLSQRKVSTTIELVEGQTFCIAGLLSHNVAANKEATPLLGDLPVLGPLFRSVRYQRKETELVVLVTPRLVEAMNPGQMPPAPGENWRHPTENDLFLKGDLGGPLSRQTAPTTAPTQPPPRYYGQYGFTPVAGE